MAPQTAADFVPDSHDLDALADAAHGCKGCDLYLNANQTVFGVGAPHADMMLVGEQPGDQEDKAGAPFVFAPAEGPDWFAARGWRPVRVEPLFREAARTRRLPWLYQLLSHLPEPKRWNPKRPWSAICLLERSPGTDGR